MAVVPPLVVYGADRVSAAEYEASAVELRDRLCSLPTIAPRPYRYQNRGDYDGNLVLRPEFASGEAGLGVHYTRP
jgi:NAD(P)H dehydrogenase (quinone)